MFETKNVLTKESNWWWWRRRSKAIDDDDDDNDDGSEAQMKICWKFLIQLWVIGSAVVYDKLKWWNPCEMAITAIRHLSRKTISMHQLLVCITDTPWTEWRRSNSHSVNVRARTHTHARTQPHKSNLYTFHWRWSRQKPRRNERTNERKQEATAAAASRQKNPL